jgi:nucleoid-associated protein EbfC
VTDSGFDMGSLLEQAQAMQQQLLEAQAEAAGQEVEGQSGGGVVRVRVTGGMDFVSVSIDPSAVDPDDVALLEDLVLAALHDAVAKAKGLTQEALGGLDLGGLGLPT